MKKHITKKFSFLILTAVCALSLFSCKKEPPTVAPESTAEPETTIQLGCGDNHNFVDGFCTECGKQEKVEAVESLEYTLSEDGSYYTVSGIGTVKNTEITIPAYYEGKPIKAVGDGAFKYQTQITAINLPDSIEMIGKDAFRGCTELTAFTVPRSLKAVGDDAFRGCNIGRVEVKSFGTWCGIDFEDLEANPMHKGAVFTMDNEPISKIVFDENETEIKKYTFAGCKNLISIVLPKKLETICEGAFYGCTSLEKLNIPKSTKSIGSRAFYDCESIFEIAFDGKLSEWKEINSGDDWNGGISKYTLKCNDTTEEVKLLSTGLAYTPVNLGYAFSVSGIGTCTDTELIIPKKHNGKSVLLIGAECFNKCNTVKSITIPDSVTEIADYAFAYCTSLTDIYYIGTKDKFKKINKHALWADKAPQFTIHCTDGDISFAEATNASDLEFALSEDKTYYIVSGRGNVTGTIVIVPAEYNGLPVKSINKYAFYDDNILTTLIISEGVVSIGKEAFRSSGIKSITLPSTLTTVYQGAFSFTNIEEINISSIESWCNISFSDATSNPISARTTIYVNGEPLTKLVIGSSVAKIGNYQFANLTGITDLKIEGSVKRVGSYAFSNCVFLKSVEICDGVESISDHAFTSCSSLSDIKFPKTLTNIGKYAFAYCQSLKELELPQGLRTINAYAFTFCSNIVEISFPDTLTLLETHAFYHCFLIKELVIPKGIRKIDQQFADCSGIQKIFIHKNVSYVNVNQFNLSSDSIEIIYDGTKAEWNNSLNVYFNTLKIPYTVHCTDGIID